MSVYDCPKHFKATDDAKLQHSAQIVQGARGAKLCCLISAALLSAYSSKGIGRFNYKVINIKQGPAQLS